MYRSQSGSRMPLSVRSFRCAVPFLGFMLLSGVVVLLMSAATSMMEFQRRNDVRLSECSISAVES
jgi:hypothetical protein